MQKNLIQRPVIGIVMRVLQPQASKFRGVELGSPVTARGVRQIVERPPPTPADAALPSSA